MTSDNQFTLIAAAITPLGADGNLSLSAVAAHARWLKQQGITAVFVAGSTGEGQSLSTNERFALTETWMEAARGHGMRVLVQVGSTCQQEACRLASHAQQCGVDGIAMLPPFYFRPENVSQLVEYCRPVAEKAGGLPFYYYHIPEITGVHLSMVDFLRQSSREISNLAGIKYTNSDLMQLQECILYSDGAYEIFFGQDEALLAGYVLGARGAIGSTYNIAAPLFGRIIEAAERRDIRQARAIQGEALELIRTLSRFGYLAAAKATMDWLGVPCGPVRPPLRNLTADEKLQLLSQLEKCSAFTEFEICDHSTAKLTG